jgi:hypothetical protein
MSPFSPSLPLKPVPGISSEKVACPLFLCPLFLSPFYPGGFNAENAEDAEKDGNRVKADGVPKRVAPRGRGKSSMSPFSPPFSPVPFFPQKRQKSSLGSEHQMPEVVFNEIVQKVARNASEQ